MSTIERRLVEAGFDVHHSAAQCEELYGEVLGAPRCMEVAV